MDISISHRFALIYQLSKDAVKKPKTKITLPDSGLESSSSENRKKLGEKNYAGKSNGK